MATEKVLNVLSVNALDGHTVERQMTPDEIAEFEIMSAQIKKSEAEADAKAATRASALAKLATLGLTADEIASL